MNSANAVDLEGALARIGDDMELYLEIFPMFKQEGADMVTRLPRLLETGERAEAHRILHTLKSLAANVGAVALSTCAAEGEKVLATPAGEPDSGLVGRLQDAFDHACHALEESVQIRNASS